MSQPVLLRHLLRHVLPLEVEEHEPPQEQGQPCAQAYHQRWVQRLCLHNTTPPPSGGGGGGDGAQLGKGPEALEGDVGWSDVAQATAPLDGG